MVCRGANRDSYRWSEGIGWWLRVWVRGRSNGKVCISAAGQDTVAERDCRDEHHGRDVFDKKMRWCVIAWGESWWARVHCHFSVTHLVLLFCVKSPEFFNLFKPNLVYQYKYYINMRACCLLWMLQKKYLYNIKRQKKEKSNSECCKKYPFVIFYYSQHHTECCAWNTI
jgi:hypothetical protein